MHIEQTLKLDYRDVLIRPKRSALPSRAEVDVQREFAFKHSGRRYKGIPIVASNMDTVGTMNMANALGPLGLSVALHKYYEVDALVEFFKSSPHTDLHFYSMGITRSDHDRFERVLARAGDSLRNVCIDVANGYTEAFVRFVEKFRHDHPSLTLMAGNVVTGEMTEELILSGADIVKVGIGPGSVCTTRMATGVGYPQLSAVIECADAAHGLGGLICADGGCTVPGDIAKAFGGGADFVMLGGMLAGHDECEGELIERDGSRCMRFYGMSSETAMMKHSGGMARYRAAEGKEVLVPCKGPVAATVQHILGGVRSACTYVGARRLKELTKRTTFVRVRTQANDIFGSA